MKIHTQEEVAGILRKSVATVYRLRRAGVPAYMPGRPVTISDDALRDYLTRAAAAPATTPQEGALHAQLSAEAERAAFRAGRLLARGRRHPSLEDQGRLLAAEMARRRTIGATKATTTD